jgi:hypothetical protein
MSATITPFCIHIRTVEDANFLLSALLERLSGEPPNITFEEHQACIEKHCARLGIEAGIKTHFANGRKAGNTFPSFIEPALIHCLTSVTNLPDTTHEED